MPTDSSIKQIRNFKKIGLGKITTRAAQFPETTHRGEYTLYRGTYYLWVLNTELESCYLSGAWNLKVISRVLKNL
jgi:hypothetical protein